MAIPIPTTWRKRRTSVTGESLLQFGEEDGADFRSIQLPTEVVDFIIARASLTAEKIRQAVVLDTDHMITRDQIVLNHDPRAPGHNALFQLHQRIEALLAPARGLSEQTEDRLTHGWKTGELQCLVGRGGFDYALCLRQIRGEMPHHSHGSPEADTMAARMSYADQDT